MISIPDAVKSLIMQDSCEKNIRISFPYKERTDICNSLIVMDSVSLKESLCSRDNLEFGLCEASVFECEVVGVGNVTGCLIDVYCEVYCDPGVTDAVFQYDLGHYVYQIPYGRFTVKTAERQSDMIHRKIVAYGGTANFNTTNPIIDYAESALWSSASTYTPNAFCEALMLSGTTGILPDATYTELTTTTGYASLYYETTWDNNKTYVRVQAVKYAATSSANDVLIYCTPTAPTMSVKEILDDMIDQHSTSEILYNMSDLSTKLFGYGAESANSSWEYAVPYFINSTYLYPYQLYAKSNTGYIIYVPYKVEVVNYDANSFTYTTLASTTYRDTSDIKIYSVDYSSYPQDTISVTRTALGSYYIVDEDIDYIGTFENVLELNGLFGNISRDNILELISLQKQFALLPETTLYPDSTLYPGSPTGGKLLPEDYQECWYEDAYTQLYGAVYCKYKNSSNVKKEYILYINNFDSDSDTGTYQTYDFSSNDIIKDSTWDETDIAAYAAAIGANLEDVSYMPVKLTGRGVPYVEPGDTFEILTASDDSITTIVLDRTISGEMVLVDSYTSV